MQATAVLAISRGSCFETLQRLKTKRF